MCMYRVSFHHSTTDVRRPLPLLFQFAVVIFSCFSLLWCFSLVSVCCGPFLLFQIAVKFFFCFSLLCCASVTASQAHSLAASQPHTSSLISVYMCMYRGSFHHSTTDVRRPLPPVVFSLVSVCCGAFLLFQGPPRDRIAGRVRGPYLKNTTIVRTTCRTQDSGTCSGPISKKHRN